jgi:hypothetical protein
VQTPAPAVHEPAADRAERAAVEMVDLHAPALGTTDRWTLKRPGSGGSLSRICPNRSMPDPLQASSRRTEPPSTRAA